MEKLKKNDREIFKIDSSNKTEWFSEFTFHKVDQGLSKEMLDKKLKAFQEGLEERAVVQLNIEKGQNYVKKN